MLKHDVKFVKSIMPGCVYNIYVNDERYATISEVNYNRQILFTIRYVGFEWDMFPFFDRPMDYIYDTADEARNAIIRAFRV